MKSPDEIESNGDIAGEAGNQKRGWFIAATVIVLLLLVALFFCFKSINTSATDKHEQETAEKVQKLSKLELAAGQQDIQFTTAAIRAPAATFKVAGTVEANQQQIQQISPLLPGRVQAVFVSLGDPVKPGMLLIRIQSPQVAELHGKLHEAEEKLRLAKITLDRVKQAANRVSILKAKATLAEAESTLERTRQLVQEGLAARKDLIASESEYERARAEYNFQRDISLNKEFSEAEASLSIARIDAEHLRDSLKVLDAQLPKVGEGTEHEISLLELRSPISGSVIERLVNPGAGVETGKPLLTIANTSTLWVIANVPEKEMDVITLGMPARVMVAGKSIAGKVSYIDPRLNEDTRTARVHIIISNADNRIQTGSFAQVEFNKAPPVAGSLFVPAAAVQTVAGQSVIFVKDREGIFVVRPVETGPERGGVVPVLKGLFPCEQIATNGAFLLKCKLLKDRAGGQLR